MPDEAFWESKRRLIARPGDKINLNAGTLSPTPIPVLEAALELRRQMAANPSDFLWRRSGPLLEAARTRLSEYLRCRPRDVLLLPNITMAMNILAGSLRPRTGCEILTTNHEYGAMMYCWRRAAKQHGWTIREIELPYRTEEPDEIVRCFAGQIRPETGMLYFSHVTTTTGLVLPAAELSKLARQRGLLCIIDGAHGPGMVPLDLTAIDADCYAANCHKWLMAPAGAGFLHVNDRVKPSIAPLITSWGDDYDRSQPDATSTFGGTNWQGDFEFHGTVDRTPQMVIPHALDFRNQLGGDAAITERMRELSTYARKTLAACGFARATPENPRLSGAITAFDFPCSDPITARDQFYNENNIECPVTIAAGKTFLRVSTAWFNTHDEIDRLAVVAPSVARK